MAAREVCRAWALWLRFPTLASAALLALRFQNARASRAFRAWALRLDSVSLHRSVSTQALALQMTPSKPQAVSRPRLARDLAATDESLTVRRQLLREEAVSAVSRPRLARDLAAIDESLIVRQQLLREEAVSPISRGELEDAFVAVHGAQHPEHPRVWRRRKTASLVRICLLLLCALVLATSVCRHGYTVLAGTEGTESTAGRLALEDISTVAEEAAEAER
eukprot:1699583-Prymnesium_polylepis.1